MVVPRLRGKVVAQRHRVDRPAPGRRGPTTTCDALTTAVTSMPPGWERGTGEDVSRLLRQCFTKSTDYVAILRQKKIANCGHYASHRSFVEEIGSRSNGQNGAAIPMVDELAE